MTDVDEHGRPEPPAAGDETATLLGFLDYQRATLAWKCSGLDAAGMRATVAASSITLGGLLKHLAYVEADWFSESLHGRDRKPPWDTVDWKADPDWEWQSAAQDTPEQLTRRIANAQLRVTFDGADGDVLRALQPAFGDVSLPAHNVVLVNTEEHLVPRAIFGILNTLLFFPSGAVYPIEAFPRWLRAIAAVDPFTFAVHGFKSLLLKETGLIAIWPDMVYLSVFAIVTFSIAVPLFKRTL